ncbi:uncharacterized protein LY79DRAFT_129267, partial [Colletotrichum navitas]
MTWSGRCVALHGSASRPLTKTCGVQHCVRTKIAAGSQMVASPTDGCPRYPGQAPSRFRKYYWVTPMYPRIYQMVPCKFPNVSQLLPAKPLIAIPTSCNLLVSCPSPSSAGRLSRKRIVRVRPACRARNVSASVTASAMSAAPRATGSHGAGALLLEGEGSRMHPSLRESPQSLMYPSPTRPASLPALGTYISALRHGENSVSECPTGTPYVAGKPSIHLPP